METRKILNHSLIVMNMYKKIPIFFAVITMGFMAKGQGIPLAETILVSNSSLKKDIDPEAFRSFMMSELIPAWDNMTEGASMYLLQADRGDRKGELLAICVAANQKERKQLPKGSPFTDKAVASIAGNLSKQPSDFLEKPDAYTEYQLIGADRFTTLPTVELLGIHYLKVKPERAKDFEKFVVEKLHPAVGHLVHDMNLVYYKAVSGQDKGSYITIFAIESVEARERFWPTGGQEQDIVKQLFDPYKDLALELSTYLVEKSYLGPESGGGAAYFESLEWTDFVLIDSE
jgi:hypothetical protein